MAHLEPGPASLQRPTASPRDASCGSEAPPSLDPGTSVLVVDDEAIILRTLSRVLIASGLPAQCVQTCSSAEAAMRLLKEREFDVVITDQCMPGATGIDLLFWLRQRWPHTCRLLMTGHHEVDIAIQAINDGRIHAFLPKPWDNDDLVRMVISTFAQQRRARQWERAKVNALEALRSRLPAGLPGASPPDGPAPIP